MSALVTLRVTVPSDSSSDRRRKLLAVLCGRVLTTPVVIVSHKMWSYVALTLMYTHLLASGYESGQRWAAAAGCEEPFVAVGDQCLMFATFAPDSYEAARQVCHSAGGELAAVLTATHLYNIIHYIYDNGLDGKHYWVDGSDQVTEGQWLTSSGHPVPRGTPFWEAAIGSQQPDDHNGAQDCLLLSASFHYYMDDSVCSYQLAPLCEQQRQPLPTPARSPPSLDCPLFFVDMGGLCLAFVTWASETWEAARQTCHGLSGELAAITDIEQLRAIYLYLHQEGIADFSFWVGGSDAASEGVWKWTDGQLVPMGSPFWGYVDFTTGLEPDGGSAENCLLLNAEGFHYFRDASCSLLMSPLCMAGH